jgi:hypothetical protein
MRPRAWENWVESSGVRETLWKGKESLKFAWEHDQKDPKGFPINTAFALDMIRNRVSKRSAKKPSSSSMPRPIYKEAKTLAELVPERLVKTIWEDNHNSSFESAIIRAAAVNYKDPRKSWKVFKGIMRAMEIAYLVDYWGWEILPRPKVNILHRGLDEIAKAAGLEAQTVEGFAEFLDDLCPCGLRPHKEAVRKLGSRFEKIRRRRS